MMNMSKRALIVGLVLSALAHAAVFYPNVSGRKERIEETQKPTKTKVVVAKSEPAPPAPPLPQPPRPKQTPPAPAQPLEEVVKAKGTDDAAAAAGDLAKEIPEDALPGLRIRWAGPDELASVAGSLGLRIVAVDEQSRVVGEVVLDGPPRIVASASGFDGFSNRVREIPLRFFGSEFKPKSEQRVRALWILVPVEVDRKLIAAQRTAIRERGLAPTKVGSM